MAGLVGGILATLTSAFAGGAIAAASVVRSTAGIAALLPPVACGYALCFFVMLVPPEPEWKRVNAFLALCTAPAALSIVYWLYL